MSLSLFFFNDTATTEIYTLSLHDALPISIQVVKGGGTISMVGIPNHSVGDFPYLDMWQRALTDRKSTRLNSSHGYISYAVFCLKKKKNSILAELLTAVCSGVYAHVSLPSS